MWYIRIFINSLFSCMVIIGRVDMHKRTDKYMRKNLVYRESWT